MKGSDRDHLGNTIAVGYVNELSGQTLPQQTLLMAAMERRCRVLSAWFITVLEFREEDVRWLLMVINAVILCVFHVPSDNGREICTLRVLSLRTKCCERSRRERGCAKSAHW